MMATGDLVVQSAADHIGAAVEKTPVRFFRDSPLRGSWNMAMDEALLLRAAEAGVATLRFYQWREPTLSLGYFQGYEERREHAASRQCAVVRRATGGGAILHDRELTYSLALTSNHPFSRRAGDLYRIIHGAVIEVLAQFGVEARLLDCSCQEENPAFRRGEETVGCAAVIDETADDQVGRVASSSIAAEPFLCFARRAPGDVVVGGFKVAGSAQRRRRGAVLQHGSILFERSPCAPALAGISDIIGRRLEIGEFGHRLVRAVANRAAFTLVHERPPDYVQGTAQSLETKKFGADEWLRLR